MNFAPIIQDYMGKRKLNQRELADLADMSEPALSSVLSGRDKVSLIRLERIARALNVDMWKLVKAAEGK